MKKKLFILSIVVTMILSLSLATFANDSDVDLSIRFGKAEYLDSDENSFKTPITGYLLEGSHQIKDNIFLRGSYFFASKANALPLAGIGQGELNNSNFKLATTYRLNPGIQLGAGWLEYDFLVKGEGYSEKRVYSGYNLVGIYEQDLTSRLKANITMNYAPNLLVDDKVIGDAGLPNRTATSNYRGTFWDLDLGLTLSVTEYINANLGYFQTKLTGKGQPDHPDYRFLSHEYKNKGFYLGGEWDF